MPAVRDSLRLRLLAALLALVAALAGLGAWSAWRLRDMGRVAQRILADNYLSIEAARGMEVSLERVDAARRAGAAADATVQDRRFRGALAAAAGNITEVGEREVVDDIGRRYERYARQAPAPGDLDALRPRRSTCSG